MVQKEMKEPRRFGEAYLSLMEDRRAETKSNDDWAQLGLLWLQLQRMEGSPVQDLGAQVLVLVVMLTRVNSSKSLYSSGSQLPQRCSKECELDQWFSEWSIRQEQSPSGPAKAHIAGRHPQELSGLGRGLGICISNHFPGDADAAGQGTFS